MTKDDIICMSHEADTYATCEWDHSKNPNHWQQCRDEHFANLVAVAEREVCHALRQSLPNPYTDVQSAHVYDMAIVDYGRAIRERSS